MKSKTLIALALSLVMLFALAAPVLAYTDREIFYKPGGSPNPEPEDATGRAAIRTDNKNNQLVVAVSLRGATPQKNYEVRVFKAGGPVIFTNLIITTNDKGNARGRGITTGAPFPSGELQCCVYLVRTDNSYNQFSTDYLYVTFK